MDKDICAGEIEKLGKNFGVRGKILEDKTAILWDEFNSIPNDNWIRACKSLIENEDRFPNIKRFKNVLSEVARYLQYKGDAIPEIPCDKCDGSGYVTAYKVNHKEEIIGEYTFRCDCENGVYREKKISIWDSVNFKDGFILKDVWDDAHDNDNFGEQVAQLKEKGKNFNNFSKGILFQVGEKI